MSTVVENTVQETSHMHIGHTLSNEHGQGSSCCLQLCLQLHPACRQQCGHNYDMSLYRTERLVPVTMHDKRA